MYAVVSLKKKVNTICRKAHTSNIFQQELIEHLELCLFCNNKWEIALQINDITYVRSMNHKHLKRGCFIACQYSIINSNHGS